MMKYQYIVLKPKNILNRLIRSYDKEEEVLIDISDSLGLGQRNTSVQLCMEVKPGRTRCASSYIVTRKAAECLQHSPAKYRCQLIGNTAIYLAKMI